MIDSVIFSLIYGPVLVTLACWFIFTIDARRAKKDVGLNGSAVGRRFPRGI